MLLLNLQRVFFIRVRQNNIKNTHIISHIFNNVTRQKRNEAPLCVNHTLQQQSTERDKQIRNVQHYSPTAIHHSTVVPHHTRELCGCCFSAQSIKYNPELLHHPIHLTVGLYKASEQIGWNITLPKAASSNIWEKKKCQYELSAG